MYEWKVVSPGVMRYGFTKYTVSYFNEYLFFRAHFGEQALGDYHDLAEARKRVETHCENMRLMQLDVT